MTLTISPALIPTAGPGLRAHTLLTALAPATWGTTYLVTTEFLPPGHPLFAALVRALPAGLLALLLARALPRGAWWWKAAVLGVLNIGLFFPLLFVTAQRLPGGVAATLGAVQPIIVALLAIALLAESPSRWRLTWGVVGVLGVGLVTLGPSAGFDVVGLVAGVTGTSVVALGIVLTKRWGRPPEVGAIGFAGWQLTAGGLFLLPLTLVFEGTPDRIDASALGGYLWLGLAGGLVAYTLWFDGLRRLPVTATALLVLLSPLVAAGLGVAFAGEHLDTLQILGFALAMLALAAGQLNPALIAPGRYRRATPSAPS